MTAFTRTCQWSPFNSRLTTLLTIFKIHLPLSSPSRKWSPPSKFSDENCVWFLISPCALHATRYTLHALIMPAAPAPSSSPSPWSGSLNPVIQYETVRLFMSVTRWSPVAIWLPDATPGPIRMNIHSVNICDNVWFDKPILCWKLPLFWHCKCLQFSSMQGGWLDTSTESGASPVSDSSSFYNSPCK
jgi:hypothetical protein